MTTQRPLTEREPPKKVQCIVSGRIFEQSLLAALENGPETYSTNVCPVCAHRMLFGNYARCTRFQPVDVDVT